MSLLCCRRDLAPIYSKKTRKLSIWLFHYWKQLGASSSHQNPDTNKFQRPPRNIAGWNFIGTKLVPGPEGTKDAQQAAKAKRQLDSLNNTNITVPKNALANMLSKTLSIGTAF